MKSFIFLILLALVVSCGGNNNNKKEGSGDGKDSSSGDTTSNQTQAGPSAEEGVIDVFINFTSNTKMLISLTADPTGYLRGKDKVIALLLKECVEVQELVTEEVYLYNDNRWPKSNRFLAKTAVKGANVHILKENADGTYYVDRSTMPVEEVKNEDTGETKKVIYCPDRQKIEEDYKKYTEALKKNQEALEAEKAKETPNNNSPST